MLWYAFASLTPAALLAMACGFGGMFPALAVISITVFVFGMDRMSEQLPVAPGTGRGLSLVLAAVHFTLLPLGIWALTFGTYLSVLDKLLIFAGLGLFFGQISNSNAHELIHAPTRFPRRIGTMIYMTMLHGHHVSAHLRVHHVHAATDNDPNSARSGEGFWRFLIRVICGEFAAGLRADTAQRARLTAAPHMLSHPYFAYCVGSFLTLLFAYLLAGGQGILVHLAIAGYAQLQLLLSDYVQHYGLRRRIQENGKPEPVGAHHSWNAPKWYSSAMMQKRTQAFRSSHAPQPCIPCA